MTETAIDINADLVGKKVTINGEEWEVERSVGWSQQYVQLVKPSGPDYPDATDMICRPAAVVRRHLQLLEDDGA